LLPSTEGHMMPTLIADDFADIARRRAELYPVAPSEGRRWYTNILAADVDIFSHPRGTFVTGDPAPTDAYTVEYLRENGYVGIYEVMRC
jgi:hypothetical protein